MFESVFGHEDNKRILETLILRNNVPQRLCFSGPDGIGKRLMGVHLARYLLCQNDNGCGTCGSCRKMDQGWHPDFLEIRPGDGDIKVEQMRDVIEKLPFRPFEAARRVIIIDDAQRLRDEAANAFLKVLEEPPDYVTFVLVTNDWDSLLPTIRSRCQRIPFQGLCLGDKVEILTRAYGIEPDMARKLAGISFMALETEPEAWEAFQNNVRDIAGFLEGAFRENPEIDYLSGKFRDRKNLTRFLEHFSQTLREILRRAWDLEPDPVFEPFHDVLTRLAQRVPKRQWREAWEGVLTLKSQRRLNVNHALFFNDFALNELGLRSAAEAKLSARLAQLDRQGSTSR